MSTEDAPGPGGLHGGPRRALQTLSALSGARLRGLLRRARLLFTADPGQAVERDAALTGARSLLQTAGALKGGAAKVAQLMAYLEDPEAEPQAEVRAVLSQLFDQVPGADPAGVRRVVEEDLGRPLGELFQSFEDQPMAAASLGEVHGAAGPGGEDLAVKVQYPGVAEALAADLGSEAVLRRLSGAAMGSALSPAVLETLRQAVLREADYRAELQALQRFRRAYRLDEDVVFPKPYPELSGARVLTAERLRGRPLLAFAQEADAAARSRATATIFRVAFGAPLVHGLLNADPNPGNFLLLPEGRVGFLDFGCCAEIDERVQTCERVLFQALLAEDGEALRYTLHREGLILEAIEFDSDRYRAFERTLRAPFASHRFQVTPEYARALALHTSALVRGRRFTLPEGAVLLWRQRLGLWAVLGQLRGEADLRQLLLELLRAVDMAPLGVR